MLQDQVSLRFGDEAYALVSRLLEREIHMPPTTVVQSFPVATSKGIWAGRQLHASDAAQADHLRAESGVGQGFCLRHSHPMDRAGTPAKHRHPLHLFLERKLQLFLSWGDPKTEQLIRRCQFRGGEGLVSEDQSQHRDVGTEQQARLIRHIGDAEFVPATVVSRRMES